MTKESFYWSEDNQPTRYSTGVRLFFILLLAMAPLALIAFFVTLQIDRNTENSRNEAAISAVNLSALQLDNALNKIQDDLRKTKQLLARSGPQKACHDLTILADQNGFDSGFLFENSSGEPSCTIGIMPENIAHQIFIGDAEPVQIANNQSGLILNVRNDGEKLAASVFISDASLLELADPEDNLPLSDLRLHSGNEDLLLKSLPIRRKSLLQEPIIAPQSVLGMELVLQLPKPPAVSPNYFIRLLLVMMMVFAAMIGWVIVNRMLLQPLKSLQHKMHDYAPGVAVTDLQQTNMMAPEIRELDNVFNQMASKVNDDKTALASSLDHQKKLTREVHHRVKNNLQIITSLLNLHGRAISEPALKEHYSMIQRRVEALSVVHRNHFAQGEAANGISLRALVSEILSSFRTGERHDIASRCDIDCGQHQVEQDIAMPIAFLLTELLEVIETLDKDSQYPIIISAQSDNSGKLMRLSLSNQALVGNDATDILSRQNIRKIITGLTRQLRADLVHDKQHGTIAIAVPVAHSV